MSEFLNVISGDSVVYDSGKKKKWSLRLAMFYFLFIPLSLAPDSVYFRDAFFDGRHITDALFVAYFFLMLYTAGKQLQKLMLLLVVMSYLAELLCSEVFLMYSYKGNAIPLYVPFGHAIVYASGYIIAKTAIARENAKNLQVAFPVFFIMIFTGAVILWNDIFSIIFGVLFFLVLKRKRGDILYYIVPFCAIFAEFTGANFGCWTWSSLMFGVFPSGNPPVGAVFMYAAGDVLLMKMIAIWDKRKKLKRSTT